MHNRKSRNQEHGAIFIEAIISLSTFMFAMFTLLTVTQIAYVQSRMSVALCSAAKEIAEYTHIFFITGLNESFSGTGGKSSEIFDQVGNFLTTLGGELGDVSEELGELLSGAGVTTAGGEVTEFGAGMEDFLNDAGSATAATSLTNIAKNGTGSLLAQKLMENNLGDGSKAAAAAFKKHYRVKNLHMLQSSVLEEGNHIYLRATYDIRVIQLLSVDYTFHMSTWAYAEAWSGQK